MSASHGGSTHSTVAFVMPMVMAGKFSAFFPGFGVGRAPLPMAWLSRCCAAPVEEVHPPSPPSPHHHHHHHPAPPPLTRPAPRTRSLPCAHSSHLLCAPLLSAAPVQHTPLRCSRAAHSVRGRRLPAASSSSSRPRATRGASATRAAARGTRTRSRPSLGARCLQREPSPQSPGCACAAAAQETGRSRLSAGERRDRPARHLKGRWQGAATNKPNKILPPIRTPCDTERQRGANVARATTTHPLTHHHTHPPTTTTHPSTPPHHTPHTHPTLPHSTHPPRARARSVRRLVVCGVQVLLDALEARLLRDYPAARCRRFVKPPSESRTRTLLAARRAGRRPRGWHLAPALQADLLAADAAVHGARPRRMQVRRFMGHLR